MVEHTPRYSDLPDDVPDFTDAFDQDGGMEPLDGYDDAEPNLIAPDNGDVSYEVNDGAAAEDTGDQTANGPPDLSSFLDRLRTDSDYSPPAYKPAPGTPAGFVVPGEESGPPAGSDANPGARRALIRLDYPEGDRAIRLDVDTDPHSYLTVTGDTSFEAYTKRFGGRMLAADVAVEQTGFRRGHAEVTAVHGIEEPYDGEPLGDNPPPSVVIEGQVVRFDPEMDVRGIVQSRRGLTHLPMVEISLDNQPGGRTVWVPSESISGGRFDATTHPLTPMAGDRMQFRVPTRSIREVEVPGQRPGLVAVPVRLYGAFHSSVPANYLLEHGEARQTFNAEQLAETDSLVADIAAAANPQAVAGQLSEYLGNRFVTLNLLDQFGGPQRSGALSLREAEVAAITEALRAKDWPPDDLPAGLQLLENRQWQGAAPIDEHPLRTLADADSHLRGEGHLPIGASVLAMTRGQIKDLAVQVLDGSLARLDEGIRPSLTPLLDVLDHQTRRETVDALVDRAVSLTAYQLLWGETRPVLFDIFDAANDQQSQRLAQTICAAVDTPRELASLRERPTRSLEESLMPDPPPERYDLVNTLLGIAEHALPFQWEHNRLQYNVSYETYKGWRETARNLLQMVDRINEANEILTKEQQRRIGDLRKLPF